MHRTIDVLFFGHYKPESVNHAWESTEQCQDDVDPEVQRRANLHECRNGREENSKKNFDDVHGCAPLKLIIASHYNRLLMIIKSLCAIFSYLDFLMSECFKIVTADVTFLRSGTVSFFLESDRGFLAV
jgi:hypothetical protein